MNYPDILRNSDGSVAVITRTSDGRLVIAEGQDVYTASASLRALIWHVISMQAARARGAA